MAVQNAVAIRVNVLDGYFVAHHGSTEFKTVVGRDFSLPLLSGLGGGGGYGRLTVVGAVVEAIDVPVDVGLRRLRIAVVVSVIVSQRQGLIRFGVGCRSDLNVGGHGGVVGWATFRNGDREAVPSVAVEVAAGIGLQHGHVDRGDAAAADRGHPFEGPTELALARVGGAVHGGVDLDARTGVHEVALVHHDVEATAEGLRTAGVADVDGVHRSSQIGGGEVVGRRYPAVVGVAGAACAGLTVLSGRRPLDGGHSDDEKGNEDQGNSASWHVHDPRNVTLHIIKLVYCQDNAHQGRLSNQRGAIK